MSISEHSSQNKQSTGSATSQHSEHVEGIKQEAQRTGQDLRERGEALADEARELGENHARAGYGSVRDKVTEQLDTLGDASAQAADTLHEQDSAFGPTLGHYAEELSSGLNTLADRISNSSLDDLAGQTQRLARNNPGLFMLGSVAMGLMASRFFKASAERDHSDRGYSSASSSSGIRRQTRDPSYTTTNAPAGQQSAHTSSDRASDGMDRSESSAAESGERPRVNPPKAPAYGAEGGYGAEKGYGTKASYGTDTSPSTPSERSDRVGYTRS